MKQNLQSIVSMLFMAQVACGPKQVTPAPTPVFTEAEFYKFGKDACEKYGEGQHFIGKPESQVACEEHGGFRVTSWDREGKFNYYEFDYPEPLRLTKDNSKSYFCDKRVVLFGEDHQPKKKKDLKLFLDYIPRLKTCGFSHVGIEVDARWQKKINYYTQNPNTESREELLGDLQEIYLENTSKDKLDIIDLAIEYQMQVVAVDNVENVEREIPRDQHMKEAIDVVLKDPEHKIAVFMGGAHIRWSKETTFHYGEIEYIGGVAAMNTARIHPLGRRLIDEYNKEQIGLVDLTGCYDPYIFACVE